MVKDQLAGRAAVDGLDVELVTEAQHQVGCVGVLTVSRTCAAAWWMASASLVASMLICGGWYALAIEPDEGVEVDHTPALKLCHLDKRHPAARACRRICITVRGWTSRYDAPSETARHG
jgi:hypothetical protein